VTTSLSVEKKQRRDVVVFTLARVHTCMDAFLDQTKGANNYFSRQLSQKTIIVFVRTMGVNHQNVESWKFHMFG
jgi:hypothetical protein